MAHVTIIMPAFQAEASLMGAVESLLRQTFRDWELIIVDDGSTDNTLKIARDCAAQDERIRVFTHENRGASAARNTGLREARGEWIGFLDSDDWFDPKFLEALLAVSASHPEAGVVYCHFALVDAQGNIQEEQRVPDLSDAFAVLSRHCALSVHCALTRADIMQRAGTFDESLVINEDWDLWQRIARTGTTFKGIREILAFYVTRPNSLSRRKVEALATDGVEVIERMFRADPKVPSANPRYTNGLPLEDRLPLLLDWIVMCSGNAIALGIDAEPFLDLIPDLSEAVLAPDEAAGSMTGAMAFARCVEVTELAQDWDTLSTRVEAFWSALASRTGRQRPVDMARARQLRLVFGPGNWIKHYSAATIHAVRLDLSQPLPTIDPKGADIVVVDAFDAQAPLGMITLPAIAPVMPALLARALKGSLPYLPERRAMLKALPVLSKARLAGHIAGDLVRARGWGVKHVASQGKVRAVSLRQRLRTSLVLGFGNMVETSARGPAGGDPEWDASLAVLRNAAEAACASVPVQSIPQPANDVQWDESVEMNSVAYWDQVFATENPWAYDSPYEQRKYEQTLALVPRDRKLRGIELACAEGHFTVQLAPLVEDLLATDISHTAIGRAAARCRASGQDHVTFDQLDFFNNPLPGMFDLIVCSEVLYEAGTREKLNQIARNIAAHLNPDGVLVTAHIIEVTEERDRSGFDWGGVFGAKSITEALIATGELQLEEEIECELYRVQRYRRTATAVEKVQRTEEMGAPPEREYAFHVVWGGTEATWKEVEHERALAVPVLMYHRIAEADDGPQSLAQYRVSPAMFEQQMRWLRRNGYHGITPEEWLAAARERRAIAGRPFMLTFDDGYRDFATTAWPVLGRFGIPATVAIVTDLVGKSAEWDAHFGEPAPLMTWEEIAGVAAEGAIIASHSASHIPMTTLSGHDLHREALRSREAIRRATGTAPETVIWPYGIEDLAACRAFENAGFAIGFGTKNGCATMADDVMRLPRIDVNGFDDLDMFIANVTQMDLQTGRLNRSSQA